MSDDVADALDGLSAEIHDGFKSLSSAVNTNFTSPNENDSNWEAANVVDGLFAIARSIHALAKAINEHGQQKNRP